MSYSSPKPPIPGTGTAYANNPPYERILSGTSDASGAAKWVFEPPTTGAWTVSIVAPGAPQAARFTCTIGTTVRGSWAGPAVFGPVQTTGTPIIITASGLPAGTAQQLHLTGNGGPNTPAPVVYPQAQAVNVTSGTVEISAGSVDIVNTPNVVVDTSGGAVPVTATGTVVVSSITNPISLSGTVNVQGVSGGTAIGVAGTVSVSSGTIDIGNTPSVTVASGTIDIGSNNTVTVGNTPNVSVTSGTIDINAGTVDIGNTPTVNSQSSQSILYNAVVSANTSFSVNTPAEYHSLIVGVSGAATQITVTGNTSNIQWYQGVPTPLAQFPFVGALDSSVTVAVDILGTGAGGSPTVTLTGILLPSNEYESPYAVSQQITYDSYATVVNNPPTAGTSNSVALLASGLPTGQAYVLGTATIRSASSTACEMSLQDSGGNIFADWYTSDTLPTVVIPLEGLLLHNGVGVNFVTSELARCTITYRIGKDISFRS